MGLLQWFGWPNRDWTLPTDEWSGPSPASSRPQLPSRNCRATPQYASDFITKNQYKAELLLRDIVTSDPHSLQIASKTIFISDKIWKNKINRYNFIAVAYLWSSSGFITYLVMYYSKYFKGDFYINYSLQGLANSIAMIYVSLLSKFLNLKGLLRFVAIMMLIFTTVLYFVMKYSASIPSAEIVLIPLFILLIQL